MPELQLDITTDDGIMPTFTCWPEGDGPFPAIVFYMDAPGIREELYDMARRMASHGYYVILPDLFYRCGTLRFPHRSPQTAKIWQTAMTLMPNAGVMSDTKAMLAYMDGLDIVKAGNHWILYEWPPCDRSGGHVPGCICRQRIALWGWDRDGRGRFFALPHQGYQG